MTPDAAAALLDAHPDYRVLRRFVPRARYADLTGRATMRAAVVDTETTGTLHASDRIIELGIVVFEFDPATGEVGAVLDHYDGLEDPGFPIPPESTAVHGITDAMVTGQSIDDARVAAMLSDVSLVIAHNAGFDRPFLEARLPLFESLPWGCSFKQVDWSALGVGSGKLEFIATCAGLFYDAHRAQADCEVLLHLLQHPFGDPPDRPLRQIAAAAGMNGFRIGALNSPFETKDILKARGYQWDAQRRLWTVSVLGEDTAREEAAWLQAMVYGGRACRLEVERLPATIRFSHRQGKVVYKDMPAAGR